MLPLITVEEIKIVFKKDNIKNMNQLHMPTSNMNRFIHRFYAFLITIEYKYCVEKIINSLRHAVESICILYKCVGQLNTSS